MKKPELIPNFIKIAVLNTEYSVIVCWGKPSEVVKVLADAGYPENDWEADCFDRNRGLCFSREELHSVIALPGKPRTAQEMGTLAHEASHAVENIFEKVNQPLGGEVFAHSIGAIVRETLKAIGRK